MSDFNLGEKFDFRDKIKKFFRFLVCRLSSEIILTLFEAFSEKENCDKITVLWNRMKNQILFKNNPSDIYVSPIKTNLFQI